MPEQTDNSNEIWQRIAGFWDRHIGEGNDFQLELIMPATDRLLALKPGETVLDIACGNGNYSRRLAKQGAKVVAFDVAETFIERARERTQPEDGEIEYRVIDATDESQLLALGEGRFDAAVCSMAIMDIPAITPLFRATRKLLKPDGRFVFSLPHPCFSSNRARRTAELVNEDGKIEQVFGIQIREYIDQTTDLCSGILHQPEPHYMYHRPFSVIFNECFAAGFIINGFEEPTFAPKASANAFSWEKRAKIPPAAVIRALPDAAFCLS